MSDDILYLKGVDEFDWYFENTDTTFGFSNLNSVVLSKNLKSIPTSVFVYSYIKEIIVPENIKWLNEGAFANCEHLKSVSLPSQINIIPAYTFTGCTSLETVDLPNIVKIEEYAFYYCTSLTSLTIPDSVTYIEDEAFRDVPHIEYHGTAEYKYYNEYWGALSMN